MEPYFSDRKNLYNLTAQNVVKRKYVDVISARLCQFHMSAKNVNSRGLKMGQVGVSLKIMPTSPEVDLEAVKAKISESLKITDSKIEPLAFGLKSLTILIITPDKGGSGGTEEIEKTVRAVEGVESVEVDSVSVI